jgi:hypothetical protein
LAVPLATTRRTASMNRSHEDVGLQSDDVAADAQFAGLQVEKATAEPVRRHAVVLLQTTAC